MKRFFVADWHLGETRMGIMQRPFVDNLEQHEILVSNHNAVVSPDDEVIVVGDVISKSSTASRQSLLESINDFYGRKILLRGNHDVPITDEEFKPYFERIYPEGDGLLYEVEGIPFYVTHYPTQGMENMFNIVGHIHGAWKYQLNSFNCGVDANHFYPTAESALPFHYKAVCEFYDDDVWAAYQKPNFSFVGKRGKKGTYFQK